LPREVSAIPAHAAGFRHGENPMIARHSKLLGRSLLLDAVMSGATGVLLAAAAAPLSALLDLPEPLLFWAGLSLLPFAVVVAWHAVRAPSSTGAVRAIIWANTLWAADSALILLVGWVEPNALGIAFVLGQAAAVAAMGGLQWIGLRQLSPAA